MMPGGRQREGCRERAEGHIPPVCTHLNTGGMKRREGASKFYIFLSALQLCENTHAKIGNKEKRMVLGIAQEPYLTLH